MNRLLAAFLVVLCSLAGVLAWSIADAQEDDTAEKGRFTRFVEDTISTPDRRISLGSIDGVLSSDVRIDRITISDRDGVWLTIEGAHLVWSRLALLRGRLDIDSLTADRIAVTRPPLPSTTPDPAARPGFALPELPVAVRIGTLGVPVVSLAQPVLGEPATLSVDGSVSLEGGTLDANVQIARTDDKPGKLALVAKFANDSRQLDLDLALEEPENGVAATLLGIPGTPALAFTIAGSGPLSAFAADITLATAGSERVTGRTTITEEGDAYRFATDVSATLTPLVAPAYQPYVAGTSTLTINGAYLGDGSVRLDEAAIKSAVADLGVSGSFAPDGFPTALTVKGALQDPAGPVPLPSGGKVDRAVLDIGFGGAGNGWTAAFDLTGLETGTLRAGSARIDAGGAAENLADPSTRRVTFDVTGALRDLTASDPNLERALGGGFDLTARGGWAAGNPVTVDIAEVKNPNAAVHFAGTIDGTTLDGRTWLNAADIAAFAGLVGQDVSGAVTLDSNGTITAATGAFALTIASETTDLAIGNPQVDALLAGRTTLKGGAARSTEGLRFSDLRIENPNLTARLDGAYDLSAADLKLSATLADVRALTDRAVGSVSFAAALAGSGTAPTVTASLSADRLGLQGKALTGALARFDGRLEGSKVDGTLSLAGKLDGVAIDGGATIATEADGTRRLTGLTVTAGPNRLSGALAARPDGLFDGSLLLDAPEIAVVAPLALEDAAGRLTADVALAADAGKQTAIVRASARDLRVDANRIGTATIDARAGDLFGVPTVDGRFDATAITAGAIKVDRMQGTAAVRPGGGTDFDVAADLAAGRLATAGSLAAVAGGYDLTVSRFQMTRAPGLTAALAQPMTVAVRGSAVTLPETVVTVGTGRIAVKGTIADTLDLSATIDRLPLSIGDAVAPDLALGGTLSGRLTASGRRDDPAASFDLRGDGLTAAPLKKAGVAALDLTARGTYAAGTVKAAAETSVGGGRIRVDGSAGTTLDLRVTIGGLPLALANATQPGLGAQGTLDATATVTGTPSAPVVAFAVSARNASVAATRTAGVPALALKAEGRFADDTVSLTTATATGAGGLTIAASGRVPVAGGGADLTVRGSVPLTLANRSLAVRGARLAGTASIDARITGNLANPDVAGALTVSGASFTDPETTTKLTAIDLRVVLGGRRATIERFSARTNGSGSLGASGSIGLDPAAGFPVDVTVTMNGAKVTDGKIVTAILGGALTARGQATGALAVSGTVTVARAEITVPERLPSRATLLDVRHRLPPINVRKTLERAKLATEAKGSGTGATSGGITLDVTVDAPRAVFVRGRGIDAELGGRVRITGPVSAIQPVGSLTLIRGRLDIIGQRITFTSGEVTLVGDLDPYIDLVATTRSQTITVTATVSGQASDPTLTLSSVPELPQDEVLAHFLFGRSLSDLSAFQIARLAVAAAELAGGGGGTDVLGQLRNAVGLDNLDVVTDSKGNAAVEAGRYISENVYLGVTAGANGQSNVSVNLDLTDNLKARAEVGPSSGGKVGVFYEREY